MKKNKFYKPLIRRFAALLFIFFVSLSCSMNFSENSRNSEKQRIKILNWNLQTFFDAEFDGNEYAEFKSAKNGWNIEKYETRLDRLSDVIKELDADVIIMEELEKEAQIQDIANKLSGNFDFSKLYNYGLFAKNKESSIGCAVISRLPIGEISVHSLDIRTKEKMPAMRPIIQFSLYSKDKSIVFFINHWKSKSGGAENSEIWRKRQEKLLVRLMENAKSKNKALLACGDFNKDISEFDICNQKQENVVLHGARDFKVYSPWILANKTYKTPGSYWYKNDWERIDHFFAHGEIELTDFCAESLGAWTNEQGHPIRYQQWNGKGYSDHLPISCIVNF